MTPTQTKDKLTGLLNKEAFEVELLKSLSQSIQNQDPLSLVATDLDNFLQVNETYGHVVGDEVIKEIANSLQEGAGKEAFVFRVGGDEFYILMPSTTREQAFLTIENIRSQIENQETFGNEKVKMTISAGVASYPIDGTAEDELQRKVDQALYRAKRAGANQVILAYDEKLVPKTVHFTETQLERLTILAEDLETTEARLLREALDDLIKKYTLNKIPR